MLYVSRTFITFQKLPISARKTDTICLAFEFNYDIHHIAYYDWFDHAFREIISMEIYDVKLYCASCGRNKSRFEETTNRTFQVHTWDNYFSRQLLEIEYSRLTFC